ncbi:hypothetical protein P4E94_12840 [Pontiellaceae bacterium B12219]|nr:hypothetical protein [Pontiellaceae bacterium B12219]
MKTILCVLLLMGVSEGFSKEAPREAVTYEAFGAVGDGVADDLPAICKAHAHANEHGLPVRSKPSATYHLGRKALTAVIATDTDWSTSRFTIDDTDVENHKKPLFEVRSRLQPVEIEIDQLQRDQKQLNARPEQDCFVMVENKSKRVYIRRGLNQNSGSPQHDCFILRKDGSVATPVDWDYSVITKVVARPIDEHTLTLRGGVFTTFANRMKQEEGYNYWSRNIIISRSNTVVENLTHYVVGETDVGHPYSGFINVRECADITLKNCFASGHKKYSTIGSAGKPVSMGSYDYSMSNVVNLHMIGCRMNHILDRTRWGVIGSNFCKNILLEDCELSRMDVHQGVSGTYTIRRCTLGHMGLNAIGRGLLTVEDSTLYGRNLVSFRSDYGSTWEGDLVIRNCRWIPAGGSTVTPYMIGASNDGMHDFGYPCFMPRRIFIENLFVEDRHVPADYKGMYFFSNHDRKDPAADRPFPYRLTETLSVQGLETASGIAPRISPNPMVRDSVVVIEEN